jgi:hypothetical protein
MRLATVAAATASLTLALWIAPAEAKGVQRARWSAASPATMLDITGRSVRSEAAWSDITSPTNLRARRALNHPPLPRQSPTDASNGIVGLTARLRFAPADAVLILWVT